RRRHTRSDRDWTSDVCSSDLFRAKLSSVKKPFIFFTDDNFARNPHWKDILEGLMRLRVEGLEFSFMVEADLVAWKIPRFAELLAQAGCNQVFMGVETVRQEALNAARKRQNKVRDYAEMCA